MPGTDLKVVDLPDESDMWLRLLSVVDNEHSARDFYPHLLQNAGRQLNGMGVVMAIQLAIADYVRTLPPPMPAVMQMFVKPLVEALVDDEEVKADALRFIDDVEAKRQQELDNRPPAPSRPELTDEEKMSLMRRIKRLAEVYDEHIDDPYNSSQAYRAGGANPFYSQTLNGLYLEFYYGSPSKVWTPWGYWHFAAAQSYQTDLEGFMSRLTVREHIAEQNLEWGVYGPVYAILAIDGEELPEPVLPTDKRQYLDYDTANAEWKRFFENC